MPLPLVALAAAAVPELVKLGVGASQKAKSKRLIKNNPLPTLNYPIPKEVYENLMAAKNMAGQFGLPGQGQIENNMTESSANALYKASQVQQSPAAIMAGATAMNNDLMGQQADLGVEAAEYKDQKLAQYFGANNQLADAKQRKFEQEWDWNQAQPYLSAMSAASALREGGARNAYSGLQGLSSLATSFFANQLKDAATEAATASGATNPNPIGAQPILQDPASWLDSSRVDNAPDAEQPYDFQSIINQINRPGPRI